MAKHHLSIIGILALALASCVTPQPSVFYFNGAGEKSDLMKARYACFKENQVYQDSSGAYVNQYGGSATSQASQTCSLSGFKACLAAKGYSFGTAENHKFVISGHELITCGAL